MISVVPPPADFSVFVIHKFSFGCCVVKPCYFPAETELLIGSACGRFFSSSKKHSTQEYKSENKKEKKTPLRCSECDDVALFLFCFVFCLKASTNQNYVI